MRAIEYKGPLNVLGDPYFIKYDLMLARFDTLLTLLAISML